MQRIPKQGPAVILSPARAEIQPGMLDDHFCGPGSGTGTYTSSVFDGKDVGIETIGDWRWIRRVAWERCDVRIEDRSEFHFAISTRILTKVPATGAAHDGRCRPCNWHPSMERQFRNGIPELPSLPDLGPLQGEPQARPRTETPGADPQPLPNLYAQQAAFGNYPERFLWRSRRISEVVPKLPKCCPEVFPETEIRPN